MCKRGRKIVQNRSCVISKILSPPIHFRSEICPSFSLEDPVNLCYSTLNSMYVTAKQSSPGNWFFTTKVLCSLLKSCGITVGSIFPKTAVAILRLHSVLEKPMEGRFLQERWRQRMRKIISAFLLVFVSVASTI